MNDKIDQRIVEMSFENQKFEKGINQSKNSLKEFSNALNEMTSGKDFSGLEKSVGSISNSFSILEQIGVGALRQIGASAITAGASLVKSLSMDQLTAGLSKYQEKIEAVQTMVSAGYGLDEVEKTMQQLMWFSDETSYSFSDMAGNMGKFVAAGVDLETSSKAMQGIATWAAHSGKNSQAASIAMFNLSQAISMGYVDTLNWRSIMNQNMNTVMFKQIAIGVAEATGAIKEGQVTIQNFDSNLKSKWFTNDILLKTLEQYSSYAEKVKEVQEEMDFDTAAQAMEYMDQNAEKYSDVLNQIGNSAFKAAQESKSFADSINATKDAVSSGWMKTYEILFGTLDEAKKNFTSLTEILYTMFAAGADGRNTMLQAIKEAGGVADVFSILKNIISAILTPLKAVSQGFDRIFPPKTVNQWMDIIKALKEFTASLIISDATADKIQRTFAGLFSVINVVWQGIKLFGSALLEIVRIFVPVGGGILDITAALGDFLVYIDRAIKSSNFFQYALLAIKVTAIIIRGILSSVIQVIYDFTNGLWNAENPLNFIGALVQKIFSGVVESIKMAVAWISTNFMNALSVAQEFLSNIFGPETSGVFSSVLSILEEVINFIIDKATDGLKNFGDVIKNLDFNKIASFVTAGVLLLFVNQLTSLTKTIDGLVAAASGFLGKLSKKLFGSTTKLKDLAVVIGTLAASLWVLSNIPWEDLKHGLIGLAGAIGLFVLAYAGIQAVSVIATKVLKGQAMAKTAFELTTLAAGLAIMAGAIKTISSIKTDNIWQAVGVVAAFVGLLASYQLVIGAASRIADKGKLSSSILGMAAGVLALIGVIKILNNVKSVEIDAGLEKIKAILRILISTQILFGVASFIGGGDKLSSSVLGMATGILLLIGVIKIIKNIGLDEITDGLKKIAWILLVLSGAQALFGLAAKIGGGKKVSTNFLSMTIAIAAMVGLIKLINLFTPAEIETAKSVLWQFTAMLAILQVVAGLSALMGKGSKLSSNLLSMTIGIAAMVGLIKLINFYTPEELKVGLISLGIMAAIIAGIQLISGLAAKIGGGAKTSSSLLSITVLLSAMGGILALLSIIPAESLKSATSAMVNTAAAVSVLILALSMFSYTAQDSIGKMLGLGASLVIFAAAIALMAIPLAQLSALDATSLIAGVIALGALVGIFTGMAAIFEKLNVGATSLLSLAASLTIFGAALTIMSVPMLMLASIDSGQMWNTVGALSALMAVFAAMGLLNGIFDGAMLGAAGALAAFGAALILIGGAVTLTGLGLKLGAEAINTLVTAFGTLITIVADNRDTLVSDFSILGEAIATGIFTGITSFFNHIGEALNNAWNQIVTSVKNFFGIHSPSTVMEKIGENLPAGLLSGILNGVSKVVEGAKDMGTRIINGVKGIFDSHSPSRVFETIGGWCTKGLAAGITGETKFAEKAAKNMGLNTEEAIRNTLGVHSMSDVWKKIGSWLPKSLGSGIDSAKGGLLNTAEGLGLDTGSLTTTGIKEAIDNGEGSITSKLKGLLNILRGDPDLAAAAESVGLSIGGGVTDGLSDPTSGIGGSTAQGVVKGELEKLKDVLEEEKFYSRLSLDQELKAYQAIRNSSKLTADERKQVNREIYTLNKTIYDAQLAYIDGESSARKEANKKRKAEEESYQKEVTRIEEDAEAERQRIREEYANNQKSINDKLLSDIAAKNKAYEDSVKSRADSIYKSYGLFDAVERDSKVTGATLLKNLKDQEAALEDWKKSLDDLRGRGVDEALVSEIEAMGPANKAQIKALLTLTDEQLDEYVALYQTKYSFARSKAETELEGLKASTEQAIQDLNTQAAIDLSTLETEFAASMQRINTQMSSDLDELKETHTQALKDIRKELSSKLSDLSDEFNKTMKNVNGITEQQYAELIVQNGEKLTALNQTAAASMGNLENTYAKGGANIASTFNMNMSGLNSQTSVNLNTLNTNTSSQLSSLKGTFDAAGVNIASNFNKSGKQIVSDFKGNMDTLKSDGEASLKELDKTTTSGLKKVVNTFEDSGYNAAAGFAQGIRNGIYLTETAARAMANAAKRAAERILDEHSPSKVFAQIGQFVSQGFAIGIVDYADQAVAASEQLAKGPIAVVSKAIAEIEDTLDEDLNFEPVITPVLDLSNIRSNSFSKIFGDTPRLVATVSANKAQETIQNGSYAQQMAQQKDSSHQTSNEQNSYQFVQNNYSPKSLSRLDIYRQTKNQFSQFKTLVGDKA